MLGPCAIREPSEKRPRAIRVKKMPMPATARPAMRRERAKAEWDPDSFFIVLAVWLSRGEASYFSRIVRIYPVARKNAGII